jgi:hypothetical protein
VGVVGEALVEGLALLVTVSDMRRPFNAAKSVIVGVLRLSRLRVLGLLPIHIHIHVHVHSGGVGGKETKLAVGPSSIEDSSNSS